MVQLNGMSGYGLASCDQNGRENPDTRTRLEQYYLAQFASHNKMREQMQGQIDLLGQQMIRLETEKSHLEHQIDRVQDEARCDQLRNELYACTWNKGMTYGVMMGLYSSIQSLNFGDIELNRGLPGLLRT